MDTNVLVAALRSKFGASHRLLQLFDEGWWLPVISTALALEYESVLKRSPQDYGLNSQQIDDYLLYLYKRARLVRIKFSWRPLLRDPNDDHVLEAAIHVGCPILTFNKRDFDQAHRFGIMVLTPKDLIARLAGKKWN